MPTYVEEYKKPSIVVVGAGFPGLVAAIELARNGYPVTVVEKQATIAPSWGQDQILDGRWTAPRALLAPGIARLAPWHTGSVRSSEVRNALTRALGTLHESITIKLSTEVVDASFSTKAGNWTLTASHGETLTADIVISSPAVLSLADPLDTDSFGGVVVSTVGRLDTPVISGRQIAVVGDDAASAQAAVQLSLRGAAVTLFNSSAPTLTPIGKDAESLKGALARITPITASLEAARVFEARSGLAADALLIDGDGSRVQVIDDRVTGLTTDSVVTSDGKHHHVDVLVVSPDRQGQLTISSAKRTPVVMNNAMNLAGVENLFLINGEPHAGWTGLAVPVWQQQATCIRLAVRVHELHGPGILTVDTDDTSNAEARSPVAYLDAVEQFSRERIKVVPN